MDYAERLSNVTVLGAAGKMGSGILLLTALEMTDLSLKPENKSKSFIINAVDLSGDALTGLMRYIRAQVLKAAEKKMVQLRKVYEERADLIENGEIIEQYIEDVMVRIRPSTSLSTAWESTLIFEAIKEDPKLKASVLSDINKNSKVKPWFFTNTSSIPISELDAMAGLEGRILGVHFYNPPAVQKLVEIIRGKNTLGELVDFAMLYSKNLRKVVVPSNDFAGFIGNGHFMRDALFGIQEAEKLAKEMSMGEAIFIMNKITQEWLIRPMGIFQLIDYVGIDVCRFIMSVMNPYLPNEDLHSDLLDSMMEKHKIAGGQNSDGTQKDGFLKYEKNRPVAVYDPDKKGYVPFADIEVACDKFTGKPPASVRAWKSVIGDAGKDAWFAGFFNELKKIDNKGAGLALKYLKRSKEIGEKLVSDGVANSTDDVNTVLLTGFFHAYGPVNNFPG